MTTSLRKKPLLFIAAIGTAALALSACSSGATGTKGEGVEAGASKEEYIAAFEDVDDIVLVTQLPGPKDSLGNAGGEAYFDAVREWSGGKLDFEVFYGSAIASFPETQTALGDGRLDFAPLMSPAYDPQAFPAFGTLVSASTTGNQGPVAGIAQLIGWGNEVGLAHPEFAEEMSGIGVKLLAPVTSGMAGGLFCKEEGIDDLGALSGLSASAPGAVMVEQLSSVGVSPVTLSFQEAYEGLERGIIECVQTSPVGALAGGILEVAPNTTIDPEAPLAFMSSGTGVNEDVWNDLPLVAQQLLFDRLDVLLSASISANSSQLAAAFTAVDENGGTVQTFDARTRDAVNAGADAIVDALADTSIFEAGGQAYVDEVRSSSERWTQAAQDSGLDTEVQYSEYLTWLDAHEVDATAYIDQVVEEIFSSHRPS